MREQACWQKRGCDDEMQARCPHATSSTDGLCPAQCIYARCGLARHAQASGLALLDPEVDRSAAVKETCWYCRYFIDHGPRRELAGGL